MGPFDLIVRILAKFFPPDAPRVGAPKPAEPTPALAEPKPAPAPFKHQWTGDMVPERRVRAGVLSTPAGAIYTAAPSGWNR